MSVYVRGLCRAYRPIQWTSAMVVPPVLEPFAMDEFKVFARIETDDEDVVLDRFMRAARDKVEQDTGTALLTQTRDLFLDRVPTLTDPFAIPFPPLQAVLSLTATAVDGTETVVDAADYLVSNGMLSLAEEASWPTDLRSVQPWTLRVRVGYTAVDEIPPSLVQAVGLLATHFAGPGRDITIGATGYLATTMPMGYEACIEPYRRVVLA